MLAAVMSSMHYFSIIILFNIFLQIRQVVSTAETAKAGMYILCINLRCLATYEWSIQILFDTLVTKKDWSGVGAHDTLVIIVQVSHVSPLNNSI